MKYLSANEKLGFRRRKAELTNHYKAIAKKALIDVSKEITKPLVPTFISKVHVGKDFSFKLDQKNGYKLKSNVKNKTWSINISKNNILKKQLGPWGRSHGA